MNDSSPRYLQFLDFTLELSGRSLRREGKLARISAPALKVLCRLATEPFALVSRDELLRAAWDVRVSNVTLTAVVNEIRRVLTLSPHVGERTKPSARISAKDILVSHYGDGYEFKKPLHVLDFRQEWNRHGTFCARTSVFQRLSQLLSEPAFDRGYIVITGSPGIGKSALLTHWLRTVTLEDTWISHHFVRKGVIGWQRPHEILRNLLAQIDPSRSSEQDTSGLLQHLTESLEGKVPNKLCLVVDGLDEITNDMAENPLSLILPEVLPPGVYAICASRPISQLSWFDARDNVCRIDLDAADWEPDRNAACRQYWEYRRSLAHSGTLFALSDAFIESAVDVAKGSMLYTIKLAEAILEKQELVDLSALPVGLQGFLQEEWAKIEHLSPASAACVKAGLRVLCVARAPLSLAEIGQVTQGISGLCFSQETFLQHARPFLLQVAGESRYRVFHTAFHELVARKMCAEETKFWHSRLSQTLAEWPATPARADFAASNAIYHRALSGDADRLLSLCFEIDHLRAKIEIDGVEALECDLALAARCDDASVSGRISDLRLAIGRQAHWIRKDVGATGTLLQFALRGVGWSEKDSSFGLRPRGHSQVRLVHPLQHSGDAMRVLPLPGNTTWDCRVARDAQTLACTAFQNIAVWDLGGGRLRRLLRGHTGMILGCAISTDSRMIASAGFDCTVRLWDLRTGECLRMIREGSIVGRLAFAPDGQIITPCWDGTIGIWDAADGRLARRIRAHTRPVLRCVLSPDGQRILSSSSDRTLALWERSSGRQIHRLMGHTGSVVGCDIDSSGRNAVSGARDDSIRLWDLREGTEVEMWSASQGGVNHCVFTEDGTEVVSAGNDGSIKRWELATAEEKGRVPGYSLGAHSLALVPGTSHIVTGGYSGIIKVWDMHRLSPGLHLERHAASVTHCVLSRDQRWACTGADDRTARIWDVEAGRSVQVLRGHTGPITSFTFDPEARRLATGAEDLTVRVWNLETGECARICKGHLGWVTACMYAGDALLTGSVDGTVRRWDLTTGGADTLWSNGGRAIACGTSGAGCVVLGFEDGGIDVWCESSPRSRLALHGHSGGVMRCVIAPDGRVAASVGADRVVKIWELDSGQCIARFVGHKETITDCTFFAAGRRLVTVSTDCTIRLWNIESQRCEQTWYGSAAFLSVAAGDSCVVAGDFVGNVWLLNCS